MKSSSFLARVAKMTLVTGLTLVALILLATYASVLGTRSKSSGIPSPDLYRAYNEESASIGSVASYSIADTDGIDVAVTPPATSIEQKVIKTASLDIEAKSATDTTTSIEEIAAARQGFVQNSSVSEGVDGRHYANITVRVPSSEFGAAMTAIKALATRINIESVTGQDVTEQYTDIAARLTAAKAQEEQYLLILTQAETVGEVLAVQEHLASVRADIESFQGQINYLENRTSLATISVAISEEPSASIPANDKFDLGRDANAALAFVIALGQQALTVLIWVLIVGVAIGIPLGIIFFFVRAFANHGKNDKRRR